MNLIQTVKKFDPGIIIIPIFLVFFGLISIYSSSLRINNFINFEKQLFFFISGIILMIMIGFSDWRFLRNESFFILFSYIIGIFLLIGLFFLVPEIRGTKSWYKIGSFSLDPAEPMKIIIILLLAKYFSQRHIELYNLRHIFISGIYIGIPAILIFLRPDIGQILILGSMWIGILFASGIKIKHFLLLCTLFIIIFSLSWFFVLKNYQKERILTFIYPQKDYLGIGWQQAQSKIAVGSGELFGRGFGQGPQTQYGFLPENQTDFIFASIAEEFGFLSVSVLLILVLLLWWRILHIAITASNNFVRLFAVGFVIVLASQSFLNIAVNLGLFPVVGIPLPFVSYGGSGLIMNYVALGILQSIKTH